MREPLVLKNRGEKIFATLELPADVENPPFVVVIHGYASNKVGSHRAYVDLAEGLSKVGIGCLRFDMRGCGDSEGSLSRMSVDDFVSDLKVVCEYLEGEGHRRVGFFGSSFGGAIALFVASQFPLVRSLVLWAPMASGKLWHQDWIKLHPEHVHDPLTTYLGIAIDPKFRDQFPLLDAAKEVEKLKELPLLHLHGAQDQVISLAHQKAFQDHRRGATARTEFVTYPDAGHRLGLSQGTQKVITKSIRWFQETL